MKIPQQPWQQNAFKYGITFLIVISSIWSASGLEITLERIKRIAKDIKEDEEWVNDSHTRAKHIGVCDGLDRLIEHLEETQEY